MGHSHQLLHVNHSRTRLDTRQVPAMGALMVPFQRVCKEVRGDEQVTAVRSKC